MTESDVIKVFNKSHRYWLISYIEDNKICRSLISGYDIEGAIKAFRYDGGNRRIVECINWNIREAIKEENDRNM